MWEKGLQWSFTAQGVIIIVQIKSRTKGWKAMISMFFSPRGTTKKTARAILGYKEKVEERDLIGRPLREDWVIPAAEPVLVALPVYAGRIPGVCREMLERHLKGSGGPAIAVAVYGNREFDDALTELQDLLEAGGFHVIAAGAFVAQHSIFPEVAAGRPDERDKAIMAEFGDKCREKIAAYVPGEHVPISVRGSHDYGTPTGGRHFTPDCNDRCMKCYACAKNCPTGSIPLETPWLTRADTCISCGACIYLCPTQARAYRGPDYEAAAKNFALKCAKRREPEVFF